MANPKHVEIAKQGAAAINEWRSANPEVRLELSDANLSDANLGDANLARANLARASLDDASLDDASLSDASLSGANLSGANLSGANLSGANLSGANLSGANLSGANLSGANLTRADLSFATLVDANLTHTDIRGANLSGVDLSGADLSGADLSNAFLTRANLNYTKLHDTEFTDAEFCFSILGLNDMSSTKGLEFAEHNGPSEVGVHTLAKSKGQIPEVFLRGCGLSPWEIEMAKLYNPDLTGPEVSEIVSTDLFSKRTDGPLYIGGVFISYSHADKGFADKLYEQLQEAGVSVWLDRHDMVAGAINKQVQRELRLRDIVVLILSEASVKSDWVEHELKTARQKEKDENRDVLCPITLDEAWKSKMDNPNWGHLGDKNILDFSKWKTKAFTGPFDKLLKGMKINYEVKKD
jgi:hypothetical protein